MHLHTSTLRVIPLCCLLGNSHVPRIWAFQQRPSIKHRSTSMTLNVSFGKQSSAQNDIAKTSHRLLSMTIQTSHTRPFTFNDMASYQINGKIATSKGGGKEPLRSFEQVDCSQLLACSQQKHFIHQHSHIETFSKDKHFLPILIETIAITKKTPFQNHFQKHILQIPL